MTENELRRQHERERLRDEFAQAALTGLLASLNDGALRAGWLEEVERRRSNLNAFVAETAYACADAMLAQRDANPLPAPAQVPQP